MSFHLPLANDPLRDVFDVQQLVDLQHSFQRDKLQGLTDTVRAARKFMKKTPGVRFMYVLAKTKDNDLVLMRIDKDSSNVAWVFGTLNQFN